jgi:S1-C subfamily serine protease
MTAAPTTPTTPTGHTTPTQAGHSAGSGALAAFSDELAGAVERVGRSVVRVDAGRRFPGSGVVWHVEDGGALILTADHVIESEDEIEIGLPDGATAKGTVAGRDESSDLALLRVPVGQTAGLTALERGGEARVGQLALAVARPGESLATSLSVVGALTPAGRGGWRGRRQGGQGGAGSPGSQEDTLIWTDASFYPGFGGGALVDTAGRLIGLATSTSRTGAGIAIPIATITRVVESLQRHGRIKRGFLGIGSQQVELPPALRSRLALQQESGLLIMAVEPGGPADKAGLMIGDVLVTLAGQAVTDHRMLLSLLGSDRVGQAVPVRVVRGGELHEATVTVGERSAE